MWATNSIIKLQSENFQISGCSKPLTASEFQFWQNFFFATWRAWVFGAVIRPSTCWDVFNTYRVSFSGAKRARISVDDLDTGAEDEDEDDDEEEEISARGSPSASSTAMSDMKRPQQPSRRSSSLSPPPALPLSVSTTPSPEPSSAQPSGPDRPDRDSNGNNGEVESEAALPENLSLPKKCPGLPGSPRHHPPTAQPPPYLLYHQQYQQFQQQQHHHFQQQQYQHQQQHRSPVDILLRVFPGRRRSDVEALLQRCKGDILHAIELLVCSNGGSGGAPNSQHEDASLNSTTLLPKSAFSPLGPLGPPPHQFHHRYSPQSHRRFLAAPYAGTGYLPTVIRPPPEYAIPLVGHPHDIYSSSGSGCTDKATASSPGSGTGSDKTSYSEWPMGVLRPSPEYARVRFYRNSSCGEKSSPYSEPGSDRTVSDIDVHRQCIS